MPIGIFILTFILATLGFSCVTSGQQISEKFQVPTQSPPSIDPEIDDESRLLSIDQNTNLVSLLNEIRKLSADENFTLAEKMAEAALSQINQTNQNKFYLKQIRKEETKLFYQQAQLAFKNKDYSLASQFLSVTEKMLHWSFPKERLNERIYRRQVQQKMRHSLAG